MRRRIAISLFAVLLACELLYVPRVVKLIDLLQLQSRCASYNAPADEIALDECLSTAELRALEHPTLYTFVGRGAYFRDSLWPKLRTRIGLPAPSETTATVFLHERFTPEGAKRLVVMTVQRRHRIWNRPDNPNYQIDVIVLAPASIFSDMKVVWKGTADVDKGTVKVLQAADWFPDGPRFQAGSPDPACASRFSIGFVISGSVEYLDCQLNNDSTVSMVVRDQLGILNRLRRAGHYKLLLNLGFDVEED